MSITATFQVDGGASPFSPFVDVIPLNGETDAADFAFFDLDVPGVEEVLCRVRSPLMGEAVSVLEDLFCVAERREQQPLA
jgi:hypothetical protein